MTRLRWLAHGTMLTMLMSAAMATHAQNRDSASDAQAAGLDKNKLSYAIGYQIGSQFANGDPEVDIAVMQRAIQDAYTKRRPSVPPCADSMTRSGWGIRPSTLPALFRMPAIFRAEPLHSSR